MSTNLCVAVCDENIIGLVQASRPSTELLLCELGEGQGGGGGDEQDQEGGGRGHLDRGDLKQDEPKVCLTCQLCCGSLLGEDEPDWLAGANCGGCKSRATKRSKRSLQLDSCPPLVPGSAGNAADVTTARLERSLRLGTWQEGKRSVPQATWFLPLLLLFAPLLLALCAVLHVFLDGWTEWPLPSCQVGKLASWQTNPLQQRCRLVRLLVVNVLCPQKNFSSKRTHRGRKHNLQNFACYQSFD